MGILAVSGMRKICGHADPGLRDQFPLLPQNVNSDFHLAFAKNPYSVLHALKPQAHGVRSSLFWGTKKPASEDQLRAISPVGS